MPVTAQTFTFSQPKTILTLPNTPPAGWTHTLDFNGDGKTDIAVKIYAGQFNIYQGNGTGGFSSTPIVANSWEIGPNGPAPMFVDVNGDGFADQVFGVSGFNDPNGGLSWGGQFAVALGDGKGNFTMTTDMGAPVGDISSLVEGDFNGDGKPDFALLTSGGSDGNGGQFPPQITIYLNEGDGVFSLGDTTINLPTTKTGTVMVEGDFNGDGKADLAWTNLGTPPQTTKGNYPIYYAYGNGNGTFGSIQTYWVDTPPRALAAGDLNHDGRTDLVVSLAPLVDQNGNTASGSNYRIASLLARQTSGFYWKTAASAAEPTTGLELMDLNGDGLLDAIYDYDYLRAGLSGGGFGPHQIVSYSTPYTFPYATDVLMAPLIKGGPPDAFTWAPGSSGMSNLRLQINTSQK
jgi:hypothetical protein